MVWAAYCGMAQLQATLGQGNWRLLTSVMAAANGEQIGRAHRPQLYERNEEVFWTSSVSPVS